jgi:microcystin-dependent protein
MAQPYLGQLILASFNFAPKNYALCNGQIMPINQYQALFSLLGTFYGGNGVQTFALPNLQGRTPIGVGNGFSIGEIGGTETVTLLSSHVPIHTHAVNAVGAADRTTVAGSMVAGGGTAIFAAPTNLVAMNNGVLTSFGGSQPHENRQPYLVMNWCIALSGIFPSQN